MGCSSGPPRSSPGSADRPGELQALRRNASIVYLRCDADTLVGRVTHDAPRPWLDTVDPRDFVEQTLARRDPVLSSLAQHVVDAGASLPDVVDAVARLAAPRHRAAVTDISAGRRAPGLHTDGSAAVRRTVASRATELDGATADALRADPDRSVRTARAAALGTTD